MGKEIEVATGVGIDEVKRLLGHSSIQITVDTYGTLSSRKGKTDDSDECHGSGPEGKANCLKRVLVTSYGYN
jgi:hypothetical protein